MLFAGSLRPTRAARCSSFRKAGFLDHIAGTVVSPPFSDLPASIEGSGAHERPVGAKELPRPVHLPIQVGATEANIAVWIVVDRALRALWQVAHPVDHGLMFWFRRKTL